MDASSIDTGESKRNEDYTGSVCLLHSLTKKWPAYQQVLIDVEDFEHVIRFKWNLNKQGKCRITRVTRRGDGKTLHVYLMNPPAKMCVDHVRHDSLDHRRRRLRVCTIRENNLNSRGSTRGTSRFKGVYWCSTNQQWRVSTGVRGQKVCFGPFPTEGDAARCYNEYAQKHFGPMAYLNPV